MRCENDWNTYSRWACNHRWLDAPANPAPPPPARKQLEVRAGTAGFDNAVLLVRLPGVFPLAAFQVVDLPPSILQGPCILSPNTKKQKLSDIAKIESDTTAIGPAIFPDLAPDQICLVFESPGIHHSQTFGQQGVRHP